MIRPNVDRTGFAAAIRFIAQRGIAATRRTGCASTTARTAQIGVQIAALATLRTGQQSCADALPAVPAEIAIAKISPVKYFMFKVSVSKLSKDR